MVVCGRELTMHLTALSRSISNIQCPDLFTPSSLTPSLCRGLELQPSVSATLFLSQTSVSSFGMGYSCFLFCGPSAQTGGQNHTSISCCMFIAIPNLLILDIILIPIVEEEDMTLLHPLRPPLLFLPSSQNRYITLFGSFNVNCLSD